MKVETVDTFRMSGGMSVVEPPLPRISRLPKRFRLKNNDIQFLYEWLAFQSRFWKNL